MDDKQADAKMWVEVDLESLMRAIPGRVIKGRIRRLGDRELAALESAEPKTRAAAGDPP